MRHCAPSSADMIAYLSKGAVSAKHRSNTLSTAALAFFGPQCGFMATDSSARRHTQTCIGAHRFAATMHHLQKLHAWMPRLPHLSLGMTSVGDGRRVTESAASRAPYDWIWHLVLSTDAVVAAQHLLFESAVAAEAGCSDLRRSRAANLDMRQPTNRVICTLAHANAAHDLCSNEHHTLHLTARMVLAI